jgi:hypothetical protein
LREAIAVWITSVGLNAHMGDPKTSTLYSETSTAAGSFSVFSSPRAFLHQTRKRVSFIRRPVTDFNEMSIARECQMLCNVTGITGLTLKIIQIFITTIWDVLGKKVAE